MGSGSGSMKGTPDMGSMPGMSGKEMRGTESGSGSMKGMAGMQRTTGAMGAQSPLGDDTGDVRYPLYLVNGRPPSDPPVFDAAPGDRVLLRIINAASDTPFRVAVGGERLTAVATDGYPVRPASAAIWKGRKTP